VFPQRALTQARPAGTGEIIHDFVKARFSRYYFLIIAFSLSLYRTIQLKTSYLTIMKKKAIFLLLVITGIVPLACCPENPSGAYLLNFGSVQLLKESYIVKYRESHEDYRLSPDDSYLQDTLVLSLGFDYSFAQNNTSLALHASALALSCPFYPHYEQLNDKITNITVISNMTFNEVKPGEPLDAKVVLYDRDNDALLPLRQAITIINSINGNEFMKLVITEKPAGAYEHTFSVKVTYESGKQETAESFPLIW
jgi:hypothetical protein